MGKDKNLITCFSLSDFHKYQEYLTEIYWDSEYFKLFGHMADGDYFKIAFRLAYLFASEGISPLIDNCPEEIVLNGSENVEENDYWNRSEKRLRVLYEFFTEDDTDEVLLMTAGQENFKAREAPGIFGVIPEMKRIAVEGDFRMAPFCHGEA